MDDVMQRRGGNEEPLPWLEAVDDEDRVPVLSARKMLAAVVTVLIAAALVAGTLFWLGSKRGAVAGGTPELIAAPPGAYKVKPSNPGGIDVAGESGTSFATGAGQETDSELDLNAAPEAPMTRPVPAPAPAPQPVKVAEATPKTLPGNETKVPAPKAEVVEAPPAPEAAPSGAAGSTIQLGAYVNQAQAEGAWKALSGRFPSISGFGKIVVPYKVPGSSGYRLRAAAGSSAAAAKACQLLKVAGENCFVVR